MLSSYFLSKVGMPLVEFFSSSYCWSLYRQMKSIQDKPNEIHETQNARTSKLLITASKSVEYWQQVFAEKEIDVNNITPEKAFYILSLLPVTSKKTYSSGFPDKVTTKGDKNAWQYLSSSGTAERMTVVTDFEKRDYLRAAEYLNLHYAVGAPVGKRGIDIPPNACNVVCGLADAEPEPIFRFLWWKIKNKTIFDASMISNLRGRIERQVIMKRNTLLPVDAKPWKEMCKQLDLYLDDIINNKVEVLRALPQFLFWLAIRAKERALLFKSLKAVLPYGGLTCEEIVKVVESAFSARFVDVYGTGEVGAIGCSIKNKGVIDIYKNSTFIEVLNENNEPVRVGGIGKIVVTDLNNFAMPIIRYEIGDVAEVVSCCKAKKRVSSIKILGRVQEMYTSTNGSFVTVRQMQNLFYSNQNILNFKITEVAPEKFSVLIVKNGEVDKDMLINKLMELLSTKYQPVVKYTPFILPESSGKFLSFKKKRKLINV